MVGDGSAEQYLHAYVALKEQIEALRRFAVVNHAALTKIIKKYKRWVIGTNNNQQSLASRLYKQLEQLSFNCGSDEKLQRIEGLQRELNLLGDQLMLASSTYHDYVSSLRCQYWAQTAEHYARVRETHMLACKPRARRLASLTDFRQTFSPAIILVLQTFVTVATLVCTYTISSYTKDSTGKTIFETKG